MYQDCQNTYKGKVVYGKDAFADLHFMDKLMPAKAEGNWDDLQGFLNEVGLEEEVAAEKGAGSDSPPAADATETSQEPQVVEIDTRRSEAVDVDIDRPQPPFWGTKILTPEEIPLEELFWYLDLQALIAGQWQFRKPREQSREEYNAFLEKEVYPILEHWKRRIVEENLLHPTIIYGYFPCQAEGNSLHVYYPEEAEAGQLGEPAATFSFPRQRSLRRLCLSDFFAPKETGVIDVFPMQAVTVGEIATEFAQKLFAANEYTDYLYYHGMAVQVAEAMAEWIHARIRRELGYGHLEPDNVRDVLAQRHQGSRYSFGYPACPKVSDQYRQLELMGTDRIGMFMDESEQLYPEQSTTAFVVYHPVAKYFSA